MSHSLEIHELANEEYFIEAYEWYEAREEGLGEQFMQAVDKRLQRIYTKRHASYREAKVEHFPFTMVYEVRVRKGLVHISSIRHTSRSPKQKYCRRKKG